jgi:hypothetical protein
VCEGTLRLPDMEEAVRAVPGLALDILDDRLRPYELTEADVSLPQEGQGEELEEAVVGRGPPDISPTSPV